MKIPLLFHILSARKEADKLKKCILVKKSAELVVDVKVADDP